MRNAEPRESRNSERGTWNLEQKAS